MRQAFVEAENAKEPLRSELLRWVKWEMGAGRNRPGNFAFRQRPGV